MTTYHIEATPAGRGATYGTEVRTCATWNEAVSGARAAADKCEHPTIFWAVEREAEKPGSSARPVVRREEFGAPSPFRPGQRYTSAR